MSTADADEFADGEGEGSPRRDAEEFPRQCDGDGILRGC